MLKNEKNTKVKSNLLFPELDNYIFVNGKTSDMPSAQSNFCLKTWLFS